MSDHLDDSFFVKFILLFDTSNEIINNRLIKILNSIASVSGFLKVITILGILMIRYQ